MLTGWCLAATCVKNLRRHPHLDESFINSIFNPPSTHTDVAMHMGGLTSPAPPGTVGSPLAANPAGKRPAENPADDFFDREEIKTKTPSSDPSHSGFARTATTMRCHRRPQYYRHGQLIPRSAPRAYLRRSYRIAHPQHPSRSSPRLMGYWTQTWAWRPSTTRSCHPPRPRRVRCNPPPPHSPQRGQCKPRGPSKR